MKSKLNSASAHSAGLLSESNPLLAKFDQLIEDVMSGRMQRSKFERWEMEMLLDFHACGQSINVRAVLNAYRKAVHRNLAAGAIHPMKLSEFLASRRKAV